ncbi:MAG: hypothetical protein Q9219_001669 [cf. Caloplaca sp. 3 TL-2023]
MTASTLPPPSNPNKSSHLSEPSLHAFLSPTFSAPSYLNSSFPPPPAPPSAVPKSTTSPTTTTPQSLTSIVSQTQSHISTLSAHTSRLSATLTALTDDILRSSSRLTYEIELLRGEANGLIFALSEPGDLNDAITTFLPYGLPHITQNTPQQAPLSSPAVTAPNPSSIPATTTTKPAEERLSEAAAAAATTTTPSASPEKSPGTHPNPQNEEPSPPILPLSNLLHIRSSLQKTTQLFSLALSWPMPPSLLPSPPQNSSLISISSPSTQESIAEAEAKGQEALGRLKAEIEGMMLREEEEEEEEGEGSGVERARERVKELRACVGVWRGTGEEGARRKWVEGLEGWVEGEGRKRRKRKMEGVSKDVGGGGGGGGGGGRGVDDKGVMGGKGEETLPVRTGSGAGFLRRLRDEIYSE